MTRIRFLPVAALACLAATQPLAAQTFPTADPVIKRIYALGMDSTQLYREAHVLFDSLGPRLMGTPNIRRAQGWLVNTYKSWGIDAKEEKYGTWRGWIRGHSHIDLVAPRVRSLEGQMVAYSPGTNGKDVVRHTIILPRFKDSTEFVKWLPQAKGKLVLISAPLPTCRSQDQWNVFGTPASAARMAADVAAVRMEWLSQRAEPNNPTITGANAGVRGTGYSSALGGGELGVRLEDGGAGGIITSRPKLTFSSGSGGGRGDQGFGRGRGSSGGVGAMEVFGTYNKKTPAIALNCEDYGLVYRLTEAGDKPRLKLNLEGTLLGEQPVFNVVATVRGSEKPDEYVVLSSHFDSWDGSSGATDNGTGTLIMLEAMRILHQIYPHPRRTILAGHWSGEEEGDVGSTAFTEDHPEVIKGLMDVFNQDNGTGRIQDIGGGGMKYSPEHINMWLSRIPTEFKDAVHANVPGGPARGGSDDFSFACHGVPTSGLGTLRWDYGSLTWHTERDTYDKVVFDDLKFNATFTAMMAYLAAEDPTMIPHIEVDMTPPIGAAAGAPAGGRGGWAECEKAPRSTNPRLK